METPRKQSITGKIEGVTLSSFLQLIEMEQKTCIVNVFIPENRGQIFFVNGEIVNANTDDLKGLEALYNIFSWHDFKIEVTKNPLKRHNEINLPLMHIIMESTRRLDETSKTGTPEKDLSSTQKILLETMKTKDFCLEIGVSLIIEFEGSNISFHSSLVGIEHGKYLLLKTPEPFDDFNRYREKFRQFIIKTLYKGTIYAFRSKLIAIISKPSKLMFIEYPQTIEHHELRAHKRFKCNIAAQAQVNKTEKKGVIENISKGGCRCTIEAPGSDDNLSDELMYTTVPLRCRLPGTKQEVQLKGQVRNARKTADEVIVGIEFIYNGDTKDTQAIVDAYIKLIEHSNQNV